MVLSAHLNTEPTWRGGEQQTLYLLEGLLRRGHAAVLFCPQGSPLAARAAAAGIDVRPLAVRSEGDVPAMLRLARSLRKLAPEVLHMHTSHAHTVGVCAATLSGRSIRRIVSRRVDFSIYRHSFLGLNGIKYAVGVDRYLAVSKVIRDVLVADGVKASRVGVVHSGVDPDRFREASASWRGPFLAELDLGPGTPIVGTVAALASHKGIEHLIDAAATLAERRGCAFAVAGEGSLRAELEARIAGRGLERRFRLLGFQERVGDFLAGLDVFAFPSVAEGLGTSLLDALALERPSIASRAGGIPEIIQDGENGLLSPPGDADALAGGIERLLDDPELARRLGAAGRRTVLERFSVDAMVEKTLAAYHEVIARRRPGVPLAAVGSGKSGGA
jgi:glycosyltransferase involved in cell wall biosynthesis